MENKKIKIVNKEFRYYFSMVTESKKIFCGENEWSFLCSLSEEFGKYDRRCLNQSIKFSSQPNPSPSPFVPSLHAQLFR
jgi:hypothetical protein